MMVKNSIRNTILFTGGALLTLCGCSAGSGGWTWRSWIWLVIILILLAMVALAIPAIIQMQKRQARRRYHLEIHNRGNVKSRYEIQADAPGAELTFTFMLNGIPLVTNAGEPEAAPGAAGAAPQRGAIPPQRKKQGKQMLGLGSAISGLLITVGNLLPYSVGVNLIRIGSKMRRGQGTLEQVGRLSERAGKHTPTKPGPTPRGAAVPVQPASMPPVGPESVQTPAIEPGEVLGLDLFIEPRSPYRRLNVPFTLRSKSLEQPEPIAETAEGMVATQGLTPFQIYGPFILLLIGIVIVVAIAALLIGTGA
ncbi:MAG: hypothetical protein JXB35_15030 [Anaerolineae bacterium]|nr:hypothetical protein [Anaerolineae bacterium]